MRLINILEPWLPVLGEAFLAIYRPAFGGLERYFTLYLAVGANGLVHLSWASETPSASKSTVSHVDFQSEKKFSAHLQEWM